MREKKINGFSGRSGINDERLVIENCKFFHIKKS